MQGLLEQYNVSLADAKQKAAAAYNTLYQQGLDAQRDMISAERTKASELWTRRGRRSPPARRNSARRPQEGSGEAFAGYLAKLLGQGGLSL